MGDKQYGHDDARDYEPYFSRHLMAMTAENLHGKGEIACELAYRDARIAELETQLKWMVENAASQHRPAYDEQQRRIAELEAENQRLRETLTYIEKNTGQRFIEYAARRALGDKGA
jgi:hypothetical protein